MPCEILPDVSEEQRESCEELVCRLSNTTPEAMRMALVLHDASNPSMFRRKENSAQYLTGLYSFMSKNLDDYKNAPPTPHDHVVSTRQGPSLRGCFHGWRGGRVMVRNIDVQSVLVWACKSSLILLLPLILFNIKVAPMAPWHRIFKSSSTKIKK